MAGPRQAVRKPVLFALFVTSYAPLFFLIILNQVAGSVEYLNWGGLRWTALQTFAERFGLSAVVGSILVIGGVVLILSLRNMQERVRTNGSHIKLLDTRNKSGEAIGYIGTYIIPFLFQDYSSFATVISILVLLGVIYVIYVHSSLLVVNPVLQVFGYGLYEVEFDDQPWGEKSDSVRRKNGLVLSSEPDLQEGDLLLAKRIGHKLYLAVPDRSDHSAEGSG